MRTIAFLIFVLGSFAFTAADDWPSFRGALGNGVTTQSTPTQWNAEQGVKWSVELPCRGNGSPIVVANRVFVTSAEDDDGRTRSLICFDAESGKQLWKQSATIDRKMPTHKTNPYAGTTPACDGTTVIVWHGSAGLFAYDMDGNERWSRDLGEYRHMWGYGSSPVISDDRVILHTGPGKEVFLIALDLVTGKEIWRHREPVEGDGQHNNDKHYMGSWSTPVLINQGAASIAVCAFATRVCGFDTQTGKMVWHCEGLRGPKGDLAYSSPMIEKNTCVMVGGFKGPAMGFRVRGEGNITSQQRLWRNKSNPQNIGTGVLIDGFVYRVGAGPNLIECMEAESGTIKWSKRAGAKPFWSSIVHDGERAFVTNQAGTTFVFKLSPKKYEPIGENLLNDTCNATPALANNCIYIRTYKKLWCIDGK